MLRTLEEALADRERQDVEFKTSTAEANAAAQGLVGFANAGGGQVFFGVTNDCVPKGIETGGKVIEDLAATLDMHIYPSLPLEFEEFAAERGKHVVRVWTPADKPPIVGGYLYSGRPLTLDDRIELARCQAYRRVGRQTRKVDFMWLRGSLSSDPLVMIDVGKESGIQSDHIIMHFSLTHISGGVALDLNVATDVWPEAVVGPIENLPTGRALQAGGNLAIHLPNLRKAIDVQGVEGGQAGHFWVLVRYRDSWGCQWESRRRMSIVFQPDVEFNITDKEPLVIPKAQLSSTVEFQHRLVSLPPKRFASPA